MLRFAFWPLAAPASRKAVARSHAMIWIDIAMMFASRAEFEVHAFRHSFAIGRMPGRLRYLKI